MYIERVRTAKKPMHRFAEEFGNDDLSETDTRTITPWGEGGEGGGALSLRRDSPRGVASVTWDGCRKLGSGGYPLSYGEWGTPRKPGVGGVAPE